VKSAALQFPLGDRDRRIVRWAIKRKSLRKYHREEEQKNDQKEKENSCCRKKLKNR